jgi:hypothetical protein
LKEKRPEAVGLERVRHGFVPTLPHAPGESAPSPPVFRNGSLGSRILHQELARQPAPRIGPPAQVQTRLIAGPAGESDQPLVEGQREPTDETVRSAAAKGIRTTATTLPHLDRIQASFGRHSISHVKAHVGPEAARASRAMSALAFASGGHVVFGDSPDLRTTAHEAAHIVQQQAGIRLAGGIGRESDVFEHNADAVADAVVARRSAEGLLEQFSASPAAGRPVASVSQENVQRKVEADEKLKEYIAGLTSEKQEIFKNWDDSKTLRRFKGKTGLGI